MRPERIAELFREMTPAEIEMLLDSCPDEDLPSDLIDSIVARIQKALDEED